MYLGMQCAVQQRNLEANTNSKKISNRCSNVCSVLSPTKQPSIYIVICLHSYFCLRDRRLEGNALVPCECMKPMEKILSSEGSMSMLNLLSETAVYCVTSK